MTTGLSMQDSELNGPAPELEANISLAKMGPNSSLGAFDLRCSVG
jgi:hypothetical protein